MALANAPFSNFRAQPVLVTVLVLCLTLSSYAFTQTHSNTDAAPVSRYPSHHNDFSHDALHAIDDDAMVCARSFALRPLMTSMPMACPDDLCSSASTTMNSNSALCATALLCGCLFVFALSRDIGGRALISSLFALMASTLCVATDYDLSEPQMATNRDDTCYVQYGQVVCWGANYYGQLGRGDTEYIGDDVGDLSLTLTPIDLGPNFIVKQFVGGSWAHHCAVSINGRLKCFGYNYYGQCGYGDTEIRGDEPNELGVNLLDVDLGEGFVVDFVSLGYEHTCALSTNYTAKCFGYGAGGVLGIGVTTTSDRGDDPFEMGDYLPLIVFPNAFVPVQISAGYYSSCVTSADSRVCCWGWGTYGQLGQGNTLSAYAPVLVDVGDGFVVAFVSVGWYSACAVSVDGAMKCWGFNQYAQLGYSHTDNIGDDPNEMSSNLLIVDLGSFFVVKQVSAGYAHRCVLSMDGRVKCFGYGLNGVLGSGSTASIGSDVTGDDLPTVDFGVDFNVTALATGDGWKFHHCALSVTAAMRCWGNNYQYGMLGMGDTEDRLSPVTPRVILSVGNVTITAPPTSAQTANPSSSDSETDLWWLWTLLAMAVLIASCTVYYYRCYRPKNKNNETLAAAPVTADSNMTSDQPTAELVTPGAVAQRAPLRDTEEQANNAEWRAPTAPSAPMEFADAGTVTYTAPAMDAHPTNDEVLQWLTERGLAEYYALLKGQGYESRADLETLTKRDLKEMGITKQMHVKKMLAKGGAAAEGANLRAAEGGEGARTGDSYE